MNQHFEQGSEEWLKWRHEGVGGSDVAAILGKCPYKTELGLWLEKSGPFKGEDQSEIFKKGHNVEAQIRATYEFETGLEFPPACIESGFMRVSLDGWNEENRKGIEIKLVGKEKIGGPIPEHHMIQMQYQMFIADVDEWMYLRSADGAHYESRVIKANREMQKFIADCVVLFWKNVQEGNRPAPCDRDWVEHTDPFITLLLEQLDGQKGAQKEATRQSIFAKCLEVHAKVVIGKFKVDSKLRRIYKEKEHE